MTGKVWTAALLVVVVLAACGGGYWLHAQNQRHELLRYEQRAVEIKRKGDLSAADVAELRELEDRIGRLRADGVRELGR